MGGRPSSDVKRTRRAKFYSNGGSVFLVGGLSAVVAFFFLVGAAGREAMCVIKDMSLLRRKPHLLL